MSLTVYIASAYATAPDVRAMHLAIRALGHTPTSSWAEAAGDGHEDLDSMTDAEAEAAHDTNHRAARAADVVIVRADVGGRETFSEAASAIRGGARVLWVGKATLSARRYRGQVVVMEHDIDALAWLADRAPVTMRGGDVVAKGGA